jgi:peptidyl-prolyl cis-trans isomerase A (cyclophilin A)
MNSIEVLRMNFNSKPYQHIKHTLSAAALIIGCFTAPMTLATTVQIQTVLGDFEVNLYDKTTPETVANFLYYVNAGTYNNLIFHRSVKDFIVQSGGFSYTGALPLTAVTPRTKLDENNKEYTVTVKNEPIYSNVRGTIAMAKLSDLPNSATTSWFISVKDNSANLDVQNGGFTVFGEVTGNGMAIVDAIAALNRFNVGGSFDSLPLRNYSAEDNTNNVPVTADNLMLITGVVVLNGDPETAANLTPKKNELINKPTEVPAKKDSGGSINGLLLSLLGSLLFFRRYKQNQ